MYEKYKKYANKGLTGLANIGNTCYLNSCMQVLSHTYEIHELVRDKSYRSKIQKNCDAIVFKEWLSLMKLMWSENCTIAPHGFVNAVKQVSKTKDCELFVGNNQNDIQEYLLFIIDCFHNALSRNVNMEITGTVENPTDKLAKECYTMMKTMYKDEYSEILTMFYGIHVSVICSIETNETLSVRAEPFSLLNLSIPNKSQITILDCFDLYCLQEEMTGDNAWMNDITRKKEDVKRGIVFWSLPHVLIIDIKRWSGSDNKKNSTLVQFPLENLDLSKYVKGYNCLSYVYDLYGVCNHQGNEFGGHYTSYVRNANDKWYEFNDTNVTLIDTSRIVSINSYCLFYRKKK